MVKLGETIIVPVEVEKSLSSAALEMSDLPVSLSGFLVDILFLDELHLR